MFHLLKSSSHNRVRQNNKIIPSYRSFFKSSQKNEANSTISNLKNFQVYQSKWDRWKQDGTIELAFGYTLLACVGVDYMFDTLKTRERKHIMDQLRSAVHNDELKRIAYVVSDGASTSMTVGNVVQAEADTGLQDDIFPNRLPVELYEKPMKKLDERKVLFRCVVRHVPKNFDGTRSLRFVKEGDIVDVLEENVGPGGGYNHCRHERLTGKGNLKRKKILEANDAIINVNTTWSEAPRHDEGWFPMSCLESI